MTEPHQLRCNLEGMCYICNTGGHCVVDDGMKCIYDSRIAQTSDKVQKLLRVIYTTCQETADCPLASDGKTLARMIKLFIDNSELRTSGA